jgi:hypothetical protein
VTWDMKASTVGIRGIFLTYSGIVNNFINDKVLFFMLRSSTSPGIVFWRPPSEFELHVLA